MGFRLVVVLISLAVMLPTGSAQAFGASAVQTSKSVEGGQGTFYLEVFNRGEKPVRLEIGSEVQGDPTNVVVEHASNFTVAPSEEYSVPEGDGNWFYLRNEDKYVNMTRIPVSVFLSQERIGDSVSVDLTTDIIRNAENDTDIGSSVSSTTRRTFTFELETSRPPAAESSGSTSDPVAGSFGAGLSSGLENTGEEAFNTVQDTLNSFNNPFEELGDTTEQQNLEESPDEDSGESRESDRNERELSEPAENPGVENGSDTFSPGDQTRLSSSDRDSSATGGFFSAVNPVTPLLLALFAGSVLYFTKVL